MQESIARIKKANNIREDSGVESEALLDHEINTLKLYKLKESSLSCHIDDIGSFVVGATTSRFWALRKHINLTSSLDIAQEKIPFYSWQCLTLNLRGRKLYLVIKNEAMMIMLIKYLIGTLNTVDGSRGSAQKIKNALFQQAMTDEVEDI